jgi:cytoskeletal protein RodZ
MIDRKKVLLHLLTPVLAYSLLGGVGFALQTASTTTQTQSTTSSHSSKRAARKAAKEEKAKQAAAANSTAAAPASAPAAKSEPTKTTRRAPSTTTPTASAGDISNARAKGMVWVNTESKVYHKDGKYYGNTKHGQFMTEAEAQKAGYKASKR